MIRCAFVFLMLCSGVADAQVVPVWPGVAPGSEHRRLRAQVSAPGKAPGRLYGWLKGQGLTRPGGEADMLRRGRFTPRRSLGSGS